MIRGVDSLVRGDVEIPASWRKEGRTAKIESFYHSGCTVLTYRYHKAALIVPIACVVALAFSLRAQVLCGPALESLKNSS